MRRLALYPALPLAPIEEVAGLKVDHSCTLCKLGTQGTVRTVCMSAEGSPGGLLIVGESPGKNEDAIGRPMVGESGKLIRAAIVKHWKGPHAITNALLCAPGRDVDKSKLDKPVDACRPYLAQTLREVRPTRIVAFGGWAAYSLFGRSVPMFSMRRSYAYLYDPDIAGAGPVPVYFVLHPAAALRNRFVRGWFDRDVEWALTSAAPPPPPVDAELRLVETAEDARRALGALRDAPRVSFDTETAGLLHDPSFRVLCASLTPLDEDGEPIDAPWTWPRHALREGGAREELARWLADSKARKSGHNTKFDILAFAVGEGLPVRGVEGDTRLRRKLLEPESDGKLAKCAELVGMGGMKEEAAQGKEEALSLVRRALSAEKRIAKYQAWAATPEATRGRSPGKPGKTTLEAARYLEDLADREPELVDVIRREDVEDDAWVYALLPEELLWRYNARDAVATGRLDSMTARQLAEEPALSRIWKRVVAPASVSISHVERWGVAADRDAIVNFDHYLEAKQVPIRLRLDQYGKDFNPNAPEQVAELLFHKLGLPVVKFTDSDNESTDASVLEAIRHLHPTVADIDDWRSLVKMRGTYASGMLRHVRADGRIHTSILLDGARSGRTSSSNPNLQNIPRAKDSPEGKMARDCFIASRRGRKRKLLLEADYSQIELRVAAMLSGDPVMLDIYRSGQDFHLRTAQLISKLAWGIDPDKVEDKHRSEAKQINFGLLYGMGDKELARRIKSTAAQAARIREAILGKFKVLAAWIEKKLAYSRRSGFAMTWWDGEDARRRPLWQIGDQDDGRRVVAEHSAHNCLDAETEALTMRGWVRGFDLDETDILLTKNPTTGALEWQRMTDLKKWPDYEGPLVEFKSKTFSAVTTPDHRWLVRDKASGRDIERRTKDLSPHGDHRIHRTGRYENEAEYVPCYWPKGRAGDFAELVGWYLTDGARGDVGGPPKTARGRTYVPARGSVELYQSQRAKPQNVARIDALLARLGLAESSRWIDPSNEVVHWEVRGDVAEVIQALLPGKLLNPGFMRMLSARQLRRLLAAMMLGDGSTDGNKGSFCAGNRPEAAAMFQVLATLCGIATTAHERDMRGYAPTSPKMPNVPKMGKVWYVTLLRRDKVQVTAAQRREFRAKQGVWCPIVPNTYFVARRAGTVYVTGNTPIQGTANEFLLASLVEVVDWILNDGIEEDVKLVLPVHDSMLLEVTEDMVDETAWHVNRAMLSHNTGGVPFAVDMKIGPAWGSLRAYPEAV